MNNEHEQLVLAVREFLTLWAVAAPKIDGFIQLQAARTGNYHIYDGPNLGTVVDKLKKLTEDR